jgi:hypothetical protein
MVFSTIEQLRHDSAAAQFCPFVSTRYIEQTSNMINVF